MPRPEGPLDPDSGVLQRFAWELRQLRAKAGTPTYRQLARRAHYAPATLAKAAGGRELPSLAVTLAYVRACDGDQAQWEERWREAAAGVVPQVLEESQADLPAPYLGLAAFTTEDAKRFFGRERLVAELVSELRVHRFLAVFGASGSGKSSLLRAGLLPAVREECATALITPGAEPESRLQRALEECPAETDVLLVVDQFEELFTLCPDISAQERFIAALLEVVWRPGSRTRIVLGVRADFYAHCTKYQELVDSLRNAQVMVGPMNSDELRTAITGPAIRFGYSVESSLLSRLIGDATGQAGVLPLVSHALQETWRRRRGNALTLAGYEAAGGIQSAISRTAEQAYASLDVEQRHVARQIFGRLIALGEATEDTKRRISRKELDHGDGSATVAVVEVLARARLLTVDTDSVEIAHEALIRSWPRLRDWLAEDRDGLRIHRQLTEAAQTWDTLDRDADALYRGARLDLANGSLQRDDVNALERAFLDASNHAARRHTRRQRQLTATLAGLLVLAVAAAGLAVGQRQTALDQRRTALAGKLVAQLADKQPDASMLLAVEAFHQDPTLVEARSALLSSQSQHFSARLIGHEYVTDVVFSPDGRTLALAGGGAVRLWDVADRRDLTSYPGHGVAFSPDGRTLAIDSGDKLVRLWDVASHKEIATFPGGDGGAVFSPDGRTLAISGMEGTVWLWDVVNHAKIATLIRSQAADIGVTTGGRIPVFSPDGRTLVADGGDGTVRLWDVAGRKEIATFGGTGAAFSPDGRTLAVPEVDRVVRLWDIVGHKEIASLAVGTGLPFFSVVFSPDGLTLAVNVANAAQLWDVRSRKAITTLTGHTGDVLHMAFSPDGRILATSSRDGTAVLWNLNGPILTLHPVTVATEMMFSPNGRTLAIGGEDGTVRLRDVTSGEIAVLTGGTGPVHGLAFSSDSRALVTTNGNDNAIRLLDVTSHKEIATFTGYGRAAFSPDGRTLAVPGEDGAVRLRDMAGHEAVAALTAHTAPAYGAIFSPDGRTLATSGGDATVRLWDVFGRKEITTLSGYWETLFSPDSRILAASTNAENGVVLLWDVAGGKEIATLAGHTTMIRGMAFSPDGRTLATGGVDGVVRLWDVASHKEIATLNVRAGPTLRAVFSPDGRTLAAISSSDKTVRLWDVAGRKQIATLTGHTDGIRDVVFSPDGTLASAGDDGTIRLWELDTDRVTARNCGLIGPVPRDRWEQMIPELPYRPTCS